VENFQRSIDLLKAGHPDMAYLYIWDAHYLILSAVFGLLLAVVFRAIADYLARRGRRRHYYPLPGAGTSPVGKNAIPERPVVPSDDDKKSVNNGPNDHQAR
jgi:hypothetical protein